MCDPNRDFRFRGPPAQMCALVVPRAHRHPNNHYIQRVPRGAYPESPWPRAITSTVALVSAISDRSACRCVSECYREHLSSICCRANSTSFVWLHSLVMTIDVLSIRSYRVFHIAKLEPSQQALITVRAVRMYIEWSKHAHAELYLRRVLHYVQTEFWVEGPKDNPQLAFTTRRSFTLAIQPRTSPCRCATTTQTLGRRQR